MSILAVARNYGGALFELAEREGEKERFGAALDAVVEQYRRAPKFRAFLDTPRVPLADKKKTLRAAFGDQLPGLVLNFLLLVLEKRRQRALPEIAAAYNRRLDRSFDRMRARITLPYEADEELEAEIVELVRRRLSMDVVPRFERDPSLLGGMVIQVRDQRLDASLRRQLENLKKQMIDGHAGSRPAVATER